MVYASSTELIRRRTVPLSFFVSCGMILCEEWSVIVVCGSSSEENLVIDVVVVFISFRVMAQFVVINSLIDEFLLSDNLPVSQVLHVKCHVLTEHQLSWCLV